MSHNLQVGTTALYVSGEFDYVLTGGDALYYGDQPGVSASSNIGTLAVGDRISRASNSYIVSAGVSYVSQQSRSTPSSASVISPADGASPTYDLASRQFRMKYGSGTLNVKNYGATGDGTTDDTAAIQAAVNAASAAGGGVVFIPEGTYQLSSAISIPNFIAVRGEGQSSLLRCTGNHFAINFNPGNRSSVSSIHVTATSQQSSGGGFNFANAGLHIRLDDIYFDANLYYGIDISPTSQAGIYTFNRIRWNGGLGNTVGVRIGGGGALVTDLMFTHLVGTGTSGAMLSDWVQAPANTDSPKFTDCLFYGGGGKGFNLGSTSQITNVKLENCTVDYLDSHGIFLNHVREFAATGCEISTCGATNVSGLEIEANAKGARFLNGVIQNCVGYGAVIRAGAIHTDISHSIITDNNTGNTSFQDGISVSAATEYFRLIGNTVGNSVLLASGHQKYGILVATGSSNHYQIQSNILKGNEDAGLFDGGTGTDKAVTWNLPQTIASVASAAAITLPTTADLHVVSGTTTITSIVASYVGRRVTLVFSAALTLTDGSNLKLAGDFVTTADDTITLVCDGTNWYEVGRSVN